MIKKNHTLKGLANASPFGRFSSITINTQVISQVFLNRL